MNDEMVPVRKDALKSILLALNGPDYMVRELQAIRPLGPDNPIDKVIADYNAYVKKLADT